MFAQTITIDQAGRIALPRQILEALGVQPETELIIELKDIGAVIKPKYPVAPITERIAAMNLPVDNWEVMEQEIEAGRLQ
jgi:bifunctional DNA-binding transcriptional regulator/antitoxin component of YhaV-PrlF toxin-antitoxin module